ncbi:MAG: hypothetical protein RR945_06725 [Erysipelotrichaceae bacterium]
MKNINEQVLKKLIESNDIRDEIIYNLEIIFDCLKLYVDDKSEQEALNNAKNALDRMNKLARERNLEALYISENVKSACREILTFQLSKDKYGENLIKK